MGAWLVWKERKAAAREAETRPKSGPLEAPPAFSTVGTKVGLTLLVDFEEASNHLQLYRARSLP